MFQVIGCVELPTVVALVPFKASDEKWLKAQVTLLRPTLKAPDARFVDL